MDNHFSASGEALIHFPKVDNPEQIKREFVQTAGSITTHLEYPQRINCRIYSNRRYC